jgi:hypothetical protein
LRFSLDVEKVQRMIREIKDPVRETWGSDFPCIGVRLPFLDNLLALVPHDSAWLTAPGSLLLAFFTTSLLAAIEDKRLCSQTVSTRFI